jgi:uncharacterized protein YaiI (UPF0178 family)
MKIWVDADACPVVIKDILFRCAERAKIMVVLVANQAISHPESQYIKSMQVAQGFDVADNEIVKRAEAGDLVITGDIPLAADVLKLDCFALNPRGERYSKGTIEAKLTMRDFLDTFRASGTHTGGPPPFNQADRQAFANQLDRLIVKHHKA